MWTHYQLRAWCYQFSHDISLITVDLSSAVGAFITCIPESNRYLKPLPTDQVVVKAHIQHRKTHSVPPVVLGQSVDSGICQHGRGEDCRQELHGCLLSILTLTPNPYRLLHIRANREDVLISEIGPRLLLQ